MGSITSSAADSSSCQCKPLEAAGNGSQHLAACLPQEGPGLSSRQSTSAWPNAGPCAHLGSKAADEQTGNLSLQYCKSCYQGFLRSLRDREARSLVNSDRARWAVSLIPVLQSPGCLTISLAGKSRFCLFLSDILERLYVESLCCVICYTVLQEHLDQNVTDFKLIS